MDFPSYEDNDIQISNDQSDFNNNLFGSMQQNNTFNNFNTGFGGLSMGMSMGGLDQFSNDPEEQKRLDARRLEDEERRQRLNEKIKKELEGKQLLRQEAIAYLQKWEEQRVTNINKKIEFNAANEKEYLKNREEEKQGNTNPWDKVIQNIQLKDGDHKGQRDISRMKGVILQRKSDFVQLKMK